LGRNRFGKKLISLRFTYFYIDLVIN